MSQEEIHQAILQTIASIPAGRVCSYGLIAKLAGAPGKARYVGYVLKQLPETTTIPWHRIVNSKGCSSFAPGSEKQAQQIRLLKQENIVFKGQVIDLKKFIWSGS